MFKLDGKTLPQGVPFTHNEIQYPANWLNLSTLEEKAAIGITEIPEQPRPDDRYYWVTANDDGSYSTTPKDIDQLKATEVAKVNTTAYSMLLPTDFMDFRPNYTPPTGWLEWREGVRSVCHDAKVAINACGTVEELMALPAIQWPNDPNYVEPVIEQVTPLGTP